MSSLINASTEIKTVAKLAPHITKAQCLAFLHDNAKMLALNPIMKSFKLLPESSSAAFFKQVPAERKPQTTDPEKVIPVYQVVEEMSASSADDSGAEAGGSWRGGWAKRFVPDSITYETSLQCTEDGMISMTHAPLAVHSMTIWKVRDAERDGEGLVIEQLGEVTSNRMLMSFIKTTIQGSFDKLIKDFVEALEKEVSAEKVGADEVVAKVDISV